MDTSLPIDDFSLGSDSPAKKRRIDDDSIILPPAKKSKLGGIQPEAEEWLCIEENTTREPTNNIIGTNSALKQPNGENSKPIWQPKTISPSQFYREPDLTWKVRLAFLAMPPNDKDMQKSNTTVYHIGRVFSKQEEAFKYLDNHFDASILHVFAFEQESFHGGRKYLVCSYSNFWKHYKRLPETERHFYELIREGTPCCLYLDLEYKKSLNPELVAEDLVETLIEYLKGAINDSFQIDVTRESIVDLDSSSAEKFSRHLIFKSVIFRNNIFCGNFIKYMCGKIAFECQTKNPEELLPGLHKLLIMNDKGVKSVFIDPAVYSRNRIFRVYKSSKLGKNTPLIVSQSNKFPYTKEKQLFLSSLVCTIGNKPIDQTLLFDDITALIYGKLPDSNSPSKRSTILKGERLSEFEHSPFPDIDRLVANSLRQRKGGKGYLRSWMYFQDSLLLVYNIGGNRFCENVNREHKSNHIMLVADFGLKIIYQKCHDPECHARNFKGSAVIIPEDSIPAEIKQQIEERKALHTNGSNEPNPADNSESEEKFWSERVLLEPAWKRKIPGPIPGSLLVGGIGEVYRPEAKGDVRINLDKLEKQYGKFILLRGGLLTTDSVLVLEPKYVSDALSLDYKGDLYFGFRIINDNDLFLSDGEYWHKQRKLMNPMFSISAIKNLYPLMVEELHDLKKVFNSQDPKKSFDIADLFQKLALDVVTTTSFGVNFGALHGGNKGAIESIASLLGEVEKRIVNPLGHQLNPFATSRLNKAKLAVRELARKCVKERIQKADQFKNRRDLLGAMIEAADPDTGAQMTEEEIVSEVVIFLIAGHETTSNTMAWFIQHTSQNPEWQQKLRDEADAVLKGKEFPDYDDLSQMPVLEMVLKESMRMMTASPAGSLRKLSKDVQLGEYFIPAGTSLWVPIHSLNHGSHIWSDPEKFNPERFANNQSHYPKFIPFSAGPRNCIGQTFAKTEMKSVLSTMAKYWTWRMDDTKEIVPFFAVTMKPKTGMYVYIEPRK